MSKKVRRWLLSLLVVIVLMGNIASSHEIYHNGSTPICLNWTSVGLNSSGGPKLFVNSAIDSSTTAGARYAALYQGAMSQWNGLICGSVNVTVSYVPLAANPNTYISNSTYVWNQLGLSSTTAGMTVLYDTQSNQIKSYSTANSSNKSIKQASIYLNPDITAFTQGTYSPTSTIVNNRIIKTIAHETGHAMLLGHPDRPSYNPIGTSVSSLMRQGAPDLYSNVSISPTNHEIQDIKKKYQDHLQL
ncbi:MAG: hypothetical protein J6M24_02680 [Lachnospiraceae bacterium]|nr:hypothetical protein [Lachnospiraceae bacterium]